MEKPIKLNNSTVNRNRRWADVGWRALLALVNMRAWKEQQGGLETSKRRKKKRLVRCREQFQMAKVGLT